MSHPINNAGTVEAIKRIIALPHISKETKRRLEGYTYNRTHDAQILEAMTPARALEIALSRLPMDKEMARELKSQLTTEREDAR